MPARLLPLPLTVSLEAVAAVDVSDAELVPLVVFDIRLETVKYSVPSNCNQVKVDNNSQVSGSFIINPQNQDVVCWLGLFCCMLCI